MNALSMEIGGSTRPRALPIAGRVPPADNLQLDSSVVGLASTKAHALIIGESALMIRVLNVLWPTLRKPVVHCEGRRLILPVDREGTLVIRDAHQLVAQDQQRLLEWWDPCAPHTRIIACASPQLFALVDAGAFNRCLFDRFREVQLMLT
ncbi:MAG: hypothetical protein ABJA98_14720 [Acidobacteriota bacterium]